MKKNKWLAKIKIKLIFGFPNCKTHVYLSMGECGSTHG
jgi:hypothetical protein